MKNTNTNVVSLSEFKKAREHVELKDVEQFVKAEQNALREIDQDIALLLSHKRELKDTENVRTKLAGVNGRLLEIADWLEDEAATESNKQRLEAIEKVRKNTNNLVSRSEITRKVLVDDMAQSRYYEQRWLLDPARIISLLFVGPVGIDTFIEKFVHVTEHQGVRLKPHSMETLEGREGFTRFYEIVHEHIAEHGGDICVSGADEKLFSKYRDNPELHRQRMVEVLKKQPDLKMKILVAEGDFNFTASNYASYRWQPKELFSPTSFYVFGNYLALISFTHDPAPLVMLIKSAAFAEAYRHSFNLAWMSAQEPVLKASS